MPDNRPKKTGPDHLIRSCEKSFKYHASSTLILVHVCVVLLAQMASACLRYLMALQFHSLRLAVLKGEFTSIEEKRPEPDLAELQRCVLVLNSEILKGAYEVT